MILPDGAGKVSDVSRELPIVGVQLAVYGDARICRNPRTLNACSSGETGTARNGSRPTQARDSERTNRAGRYGWVVTPV